MAYDEDLAGRLRERLGPDVTSKRMFGGLVFLRAGKIVGGVYGSELLVRVGREPVTGPGVRPFQMQERQSKGFVLVEPAQIAKWFPIPE